jgi:hypothetical protein
MLYANITTPSASVIVSRDVQTGALQRPRVAKTSVSCSSSVFRFQLHHLSLLVWYGRYRNRGYISPSTLASLGNLPFVEERWKRLATQLGAWKKQEFDVQTKR